jgi:membrane-associated phospholipid phosphatase
MKIVTLFLSLCFALNIHAQTLNDSSVASVKVDTSFITTKHHSIIKPVTIGIAYAGATLFSYRFLDDEVHEIAQRWQNKTVSSISKNYGRLGLGSSNVIITAGTGIAAVVTKDKRLEKATILLIAGHAINSYATFQLKLSFQRHRPSTGDPYNKFDWREGNRSNTSMVSAHTSNAFTTATAFAIAYKDKKWVPIVAYSAASLVGISRIYNNAHWLSDVMGGAAIGYLSVKGVNELYKLAGKKFSFMPEVSYHYYGMGVTYALK